jgi:hypothetical protein
MVTTRQACDLARQLPDVSEQGHFGSDAFRTPGGIFATVWHETGTVNLNLTPEQQRRFVALDPDGFAAIDNAWGRKGWTAATVAALSKALFVDALNAAWMNSSERAARKRSRARKRR